jgi:hypothetical protein
LSDHGFTIIEGVLENTPESRELIKNMIMQHGPIMAGMETTLRYLLWGLTHHSPEDYLPYRGLKWRNSVNHAVTIVGWKDDSSIANGGYWICKNTIGTFFADEGFFNIEYGALFIGVAVVWADYDPASFDWPPNIPTIKGSTSGTAGVEYTFTFATIDPDGNDDVCYSIDWGDGANSGWLGPFDAGSGCTVSHSWEGNGDYEIKGRAKDPNGLVSEWSQSFVVGITKDRVEDTEFNRLLYRCPRLFPLVQLILDLSFNNFKEIP